MPKPLTREDREKQLSFKPQILDPTSRYPKPFNGQRLPSQKIALQRMRINLSRSRIHPKIQTQILSSSYPMVRLDSTLTNLGFDFPHPLMIPGLDPQQIYPLRDRPASQCSSSRPCVPFPRSRRDLGLELQGVQTKSQVSTPCYSARQDLVVDQEDNNSRKTPFSIPFGFGSTWRT